jgi:hypothetical protein
MDINHGKKNGQCVARRTDCDAPTFGSPGDNVHFTTGCGKFECWLCNKIAGKITSKTYDEIYDKAKNFANDKLEKLTGVNFQNELDAGEEEVCADIEGSVGLDIDTIAAGLCEAIFLGPEDPLADICVPIAIALGEVFVNKLCMYTLDQAIDAVYNAIKNKITGAIGGAIDKNFCSAALPQCGAGNHNQLLDGMRCGLLADGHCPLVPFGKDRHYSHQCASGQAHPGGGNCAFRMRCGLVKDGKCAPGAVEHPHEFCESFNTRHTLSCLSGWRCVPCNKEGGCGIPKSKVEVPYFGAPQRAQLSSFDEWAQGDGFSGIKIYQNRSGSKGGRKQQNTPDWVYIVCVMALCFAALFVLVRKYSKRVKEHLAAPKVLEWEVENPVCAAGDMTPPPPGDMTPPPPPRPASNSPV